MEVEIVPRGRGQWPRGRVAALVRTLTIGSLAAACVGSPRLSLETKGGAQTEDRAEMAAATWRHKVLGWENLEVIEAWLDEHGDRAAPGLQAEAQLQLAEGRLVLAQRDRGSAHGNFLHLRLERAKGGFLDVLNNVGATEVQRSRARSGLSRAAIALADGGLELVRPDVVARGAWGASAPIPVRMDRHPQAYTHITVHHSAMPSSGFGGRGFAAEASVVRGIQRYHMHDPSKGWGDVGYHFLIAPSGTIFEGRETVWQGAHVKDQNPGNLGVCLLGDFTGERPTAEAMKALDALVDGLCAEHDIAARNVWAHLERNGGKTQCPGLPLVSWVKSYRR